MANETSIFENIPEVWSEEALVQALTASNPEILWKLADQIRAESVGPEVYLRGLIEFSNHCLRDCLYCGLRKSNSSLERYRLSVSEVVECARQAKELGYGTVVLQSGEDDSFALDDLVALISKIKKEIGVAITLSIGEKSYEDYRILKEAGTDRYLLKFETSNRKLFHFLKPDGNFDNRIQCLDWLRELGYQVGSGCMVGLPGQTIEDLAQDLLFIQKMDFDMVGVGPFLPNPKTPLANSPVSNSELTLRMVALARILTKKAHLPATTALGTLDALGRQKALQRGANILMPNLTPKKFRPLYEIYPNKICIGESASDCGNCVEGMILSLGREVGSGPGHSFKSSQ